MRIVPLCCCFAALSLALPLGRGQEPSAVSPGGNAFDAVRLLTPEQQAGLAIVAGREGTPIPERWHLLVHDPASEGGLREFVVTRGRIATSRTVSQFAEALTREQVFAPESLKVDTDRVNRIAQEFGRANGVTIAAIHYDLRRSGPEGAPLWTAFCTNPNGEELGKVILSASSGTIILHPGFAVEPAPELVADKPPPAADPGGNRDDRSRKVRQTESNASRRRPPPGPPLPTPKPGFFQRVFRGPPPAGGPPPVRPVEPRR